MGKEESTKSTRYATMVAEAEESVSAVKDPDLRRVAFEKILATLLEGRQLKSGEQKRSPRPTTAQTNKRSTGSLRRGPKAHIEALIADGFFKEQRKIVEVQTELANLGHHIALTSLSGPLQSLTQERVLRRQKTTADRKGSKIAFAYSNW